MEENVTVATRVRVDHSPPIGVAPAIVLENPKHAYNVGAVVRLASGYGLKQVWYTGHRISFANPDRPGRQRIPKEERVRAAEGLPAINNCDQPLTQFRNVTPVIFEVSDRAERLHYFEHPDNAVYIFGPEDGYVSDGLKACGHRFVVIPTHHCLNLATAVATVLWDRHCKALLSGNASPTTPGEFEQRGYISI